MPTVADMSSGVPAQGQRPTSGPYAGMSANDIIQQMMRSGFTQEGVNTVYAMRGLGAPPAIPAGLEGARRGTGRDMTLYGPNGKPIKGAAAAPLANFLHQFNSTAVDPFRHYDVGNWLGVAGMIAGSAGAAGLYGAPAAAAEGGGAGAATVADVAGGSTAAAEGAGSAIPEIVVTGTRTGLTAGQAAAAAGGAAAGGAAATGGNSGSGLQSSGDPANAFRTTQTGGNAGQLSQSGGITTGAGTGGTTSGALGGGMGTGSGSGGWVDSLIDLGTELGGDYLAGDAARGAGRTQAAAAAAAIAEERRQYDQNRADLAPYREAGSTAIGQLSHGTADGGDFNRDFTLADFQKDPGYQFRMDEGTNAIQGANAATRGVQNGRTLAELTRYGQDYASGEYSNAYNRFNADRTTRFNRLATVAGVGQTATNTGVASGNASTNSVADLTLDRANAQAAGRIGQANAYGQGVESLANFYRTRKYGGANTNWIGG